MGSCRDGAARAGDQWPGRRVWRYLGTHRARGLWRSHDPSHGGGANILHVVAAGEELLQQGRVHFGLDHVRLAFQRPQPGVGEGLRERLHAVVQPGGIVTAGQAQRWDRDRRLPLGGQRLARLGDAQDRIVVRESGGDGLEL